MKHLYIASQIALCVLIGVCIGTVFTDVGRHIVVGICAIPMLAFFICLVIDYQDRNCP